MSILSEYYDECNRSNYAPVYHEAASLWREHLWNSTPVRKEIFEFVKENIRFFNKKNPYIYETYNHLDGLYYIQYRLPAIRIDDEARKMIAAVFGVWKPSIKFQYGSRPTLSWMLRHPFKYLAAKNRRYVADYAEITMILTDADLKAIDHRISCPESRYKNGTYAGKIDVSFKIDIYSDWFDKELMTIGFPQQTWHLRGKECNMDIDAIAEARLRGTYQHLSTCIEFPDKYMTPVNVWIASLCNTVLNYENVLIEQLKRYVDLRSQDNMDDANQLRQYLNQCHT